VNQADAPNTVEMTYLYDASSRQLSCVSCDPTNRPPDLVTTQLASQVPVSYPVATSLHRWIANSGARVFFDTPQRLSPRAESEEWSTYEWEAVGTGSCTQEQSFPVTNGCTFLISGSESEGFSLLVEVDEEGENAFFTYRGELGRDGVSHSQYEIYDARVGGGFPSEGSGCTGASCMSSSVVSAAPAPPTTYEVTGEEDKPVPAVVKKVAVRRPDARTRAVEACRKRYKKLRRRRSCEASVKAKHATRASRTTPSGEKKS
jgi:hypothetical protein